MPILHNDESPEKEHAGPARKPVASAATLPEPLLDSDQAASIIGIHPKTLQKMARNGELWGVHVGKLWRFRASDIERWIERQLAS